MSQVHDNDFFRKLWVGWHQTTISSTASDWSRRRGWTIAFLKIQTHHTNYFKNSRREHLTSEDIKRNKAFVRDFASGRSFRDSSNGGAGMESDTDTDSQSEPRRSRKSLPPPSPSSFTWNEYITSVESPPQLARRHVEKSQTKEFKAAIAMSKDFALPVEVLVDILEIVSPMKHMGKLREFCSARLPSGFPVKLGGSL